MEPNFAYFAAHAPAIPGWFAARPTTYKPGPVPHATKPGWMEMGDVIDTPAETAEEHFFRWRWYYAQKMIETRPQ